MGQAFTLIPHVRGKRTAKVLAVKQSAVCLPSLFHLQSHPAPSSLHKKKAFFLWELLSLTPPPLRFIIWITEQETSRSEERGTDEEEVVWVFKDR